jgi:hypothetical protein
MILVAIRQMKFAVPAAQSTPHASPTAYAMLPSEFCKKTCSTNNALWASERASHLSITEGGRVRGAT